MTRELRRARRDIMQMKPRKRRFTSQIVIRADEELHDLLRADAKANGRTVAQSARFHLEAALRPPGGSL